jgi:hypothetical protein
MSEDMEELSPIEVEQEIHGQSVDWYLQKIVSLANDVGVGLEMGITLVLGGSVISGILISGKKYFDTFASDLSAAWPGANKEEIRKSFASLGAIYDQGDGQEELPPPQYIHLSNARIYSPSGSLPTKGGVLWRGKINAVSGFSLGLFASGDA